MIPQIETPRTKSELLPYPSFLERIFFSGIIKAQKKEIEAIRKENDDIRNEYTEKLSKLVKALEEGIQKIRSQQVLIDKIESKLIAITPPNKPTHP